MEEKVNIPALPLFSNGVTLFQANRVRMVIAFVGWGFFHRQIRERVKSHVLQKDRGMSKINDMGEITKKNF